MMIDDMTLVREFAASQSEPAFTALAERHIGLVHSSALRQSGDSNLAEEITQAVFIILARKAASLGPKTVLSAWLYRTTRYVAADALKARHRRQSREQEAYMQSTLNEPDSDAWAQLAPLLDDALAELGETDRTALVLRFFENKTAREIAEALWMGEATAQKRVARALEKLRAIFVKRGVTLTAAVIAGAVAANSVQAAPVGLVVTISATAAKGAAVTATVTALVKGTMQMMTWMKLKFAAGVGVAALLAGGAATVALSGNSVDKTTDPVAAFKQYLSTQPSISRISFVEIPVANKKALQRTYVAAYSTDGYYMRELKPEDNYLLSISPSNRMHGALFVGRCRDTSWQINGFHVGKSISPATRSPDAYAVFSQNAQAILEATINLGSQHVKPGSFQWNGDEFAARPSVLMHQMQPDLVSIRGKIIIRDGRVVEMQNYESGTWLYEYEYSKNRPAWFPAKIKHVGGPNYTIDEIWAVQAVEFSSPKDIAANLLPEAHIMPEVAELTLYSNSAPVASEGP